MSRSLGEFYNELKKKLANSGIESPELEARMLIQRHFRFELVDIISRNNEIVAEEGIKALENDLERRTGGEPLSRIFGTREFYGLEFALGPETLDPRPDTETLIDRALEIFGSKPPKRILDLGTGTGCILITLLTKWPESHGVAVDLSPGALEIARANAKTHDVSDRAAFICGSWAGAIQGGFDLVVSNPPYITSSDIENLDKEVRNHDPILALDGGFDGLGAYKNIFFDLPRLLNPAGKALFEIGFGQEADIVRLSRESRIRVERVHADYAGIIRVVEISNGDK